MELETKMMLAFLAALILALWKMKSFIPTKPLADDDSDQASNQELQSIMIDTIASSYYEGMSSRDLLELMKSDKRFDKEHYWRVNENRVNHLLQDYYLEHEGVNSIENIYEAVGPK